MYISYLDEAGLTKKETHLVVAGIMVRDDQMISGEQQLASVLKKYIPAEDHADFEFHAYELFTGNGYFSNKHRWPQRKRQWIIKDVLDSLMGFDLPIIYGAVDKAKLKSKYVTPFDAHDLAFMLVAERVDAWIAQHAPLDVCMLIADDTKKKKVIKSSLRQYRKEKIPLGTPSKLEHITDAILFADSCDTWGLQLADFCNYFIKRHLIGGDETSEKIYKYFSRQIQRSRLFPD